MKPLQNKTLYNLIHRVLSATDRLRYIKSHVVEANDMAQVNHLYQWKKEPLIEGAHLHAYESLLDINNRKWLDALVLGTVASNSQPKTIVEIGTGRGYATAAMAQNAPQATVYTVNILPDEIQEGGNATTFAPSQNEIGSYYRQLGLANIEQIYANTLTWEPEMYPIDMAFIDGCHDAEFVYSDTVKILKHCVPGSWILWHDFCPSQVMQHAWIGDVCQGVNWLYRDGYLKNQIIHVKDSWIGMYQV